MTRGLTSILDDPHAFIGTPKDPKAQEDITAAVQPQASVQPAKIDTTMVRRLSIL
jgi:hypothetical protein